MKWPKHVIFSTMYYDLTWSEVFRFLLSNKSCQVALAMTFPRKMTFKFTCLSNDSDTFRSYTPLQNVWHGSKNVITFGLIKFIGYQGWVKRVRSSCPQLGGLGSFLGSQWDRQLKLSAYASFLISWSLSKFELI